MKIFPLELTYQVFLPVPSENIANLDFELRYPAGDFEISRRDIALFFLFRYIRSLTLIIGYNNMV